MAKLSVLPAGPWRFHSGDLPHGEAVGLDDSSWQAVEDGFTVPLSSGWFRRRITLPAQVEGYSLRGVRVWFQFQTSNHGPLNQIVYFNGRRVAMGEDLEQIVLFDHAQLGDSVEVAVKEPRTDDYKHFRTPALRIEFAPDRPSPEDLRVEALGASALLQAPQQIGTIDRSLEKVNWAALAKGEQAAFDKSLRAAEQELSSLRPALKTDHLDLVGNSHIDSAWLWPESETMDVVKRTFGTSLQLMSEYPQYKFTQSSAAYHAWMQEKYPFLWDDLKSCVQQGRWEVVGGMWVEPDLNMPDGESTVRELLVGMRYFKQALGVDVRVGWNPDSFGYNWQLPQIYHRSGIDLFVTQKMKWNETNPLPLKLFWWESPDGSKVLTYFPHDYNRGTEPLRMEQDLATAKTLAPGSDELMHLYGVGDHGGGPTRMMIDQAQHWEDPQLVYPTQSFTRAETALDSLRSHINPAFASPVWNYRTLAAGQTTLPAAPAGSMNIPTWKDELYLEFHRGTYTSQAHHKRNMREAEELLLNAERFASVAWLGGGSYPGDRLTEAWKLSLFNQSHDLAAGSGNAAVYADAEREYATVRATTNDVTEQARHTLAEHIDTAMKGTDAVPVIVWNTLAWPRSGSVDFQVQLPRSSANDDITVRDAKGDRLPVEVLEAQPGLGVFHVRAEVPVPAFGYTVLQVAAGRGEGTSAVSAHGTTLENAALRVEIDPGTGCMTHLVDKRSGFDAIKAGGCGNQLETFHDLPEKYDAWNIDASALATMQPISALDSVALVETGPARATLRVKRHWQSSTFVQDISLASGADTVEIANDIDWHERHVLLKAAFPLTASSGSATYEIPYGAIDRPTTRNNPVEKAKYEVPALRWADLGDGQHGLSLLNDSKYGYDAAGDVLRLSLLRSPTYPDPEADQGHQHFTYALYPHTGDWKSAETVHRGYELNYPLLAAQAIPHEGSLPAEGSFFRVNEPGVTLTAVKKTEDGNGLVLRLYEWQGRHHEARVQLPMTPSRAEQVNLMEKPSGTAVVTHGNSVTVPLGPYEIVTVRVEFAKGAAALWNAKLAGPQ